jgi:hypothetical protein
MNRKRLTILFAIVALFGASGNAALAQTPTALTTGQTQKAETQTTAGALDPSQADHGELAANSKRAIIETGISEPYFKAHFQLLKVVDEAGDRRVEWKYSVNEYETMLVDDIGYYTSDAGQRIDVHSIKSELFSAYDIKRTIPRSKADAALKSCIGEHSNTLIVYRPLKVPGKAGLYLTARSKIPFESEEDKEKDQDKETEREIEGLLFNVGFVDLETGKCSIERGKVTP